MELERQRGISVSSTVLQFEYKDYIVNLLDTPGHRDFSEDTYRVLTAVDAAVMVIDAGKGIEAQTLKLFEVCRRRAVPIFTFMADSMVARWKVHRLFRGWQLQKQTGHLCSPHRREPEADSFHHNRG